MLCVWPLFLKRRATSQSRPLARAQPSTSTTLVLLVTSSSPSLRSCRRFLDLLSAACTGTAVHDPGLVGRFFASTSILPSVSRFIVGRLHPSTTLVLLVASSPSLRSCRRFLDLWLNRARGIPTEALPKFRGEALLRCHHFCSRVQ